MKNQNVNGKPHNELTTIAIAKQIGFKGFEKTISGDELMKLNDNDLKTCVMNTNIFTRIFQKLN